MYNIMLQVYFSLEGCHRRKLVVHAVPTKKGSAAGEGTAEGEGVEEEGGGGESGEEGKVEKNGEKEETDGGGPILQLVSVQL